MITVLIRLADASLYLALFSIATWALFRLRRFRDPALRHFALSCVCGASLLCVLLPRVEWRMLPERESSVGPITARASVQDGRQALRRRVAEPAAAVDGTAVTDSMGAMPLWTYVAVAAVLGTGVLLGVAGLHRAARRSVAVRGRLIRTSRETAIPMVAGVFRQRIIVPEQWKDWSRFKRRSVVAHEAAHIRRGDIGLTLVRKVMVCVYWFQPLAWWLDRKCAQYAEYAADDAASARVGDRIAYSRMLVEVASATSPRFSIPLLAMARPSTLGRRVTRLLKERESLPIPRSARIAIPAMLIVCTLGAAAFPLLPGARAGTSLSLSMLFQRRVTGKLASELVLNPVGGQTEDLTEAPSQLRSQLPDTVSASDKLWQGSTWVPGGGRLALVVIEPAAAGSRPVLYADLNSDGKFRAAERFEFHEATQNPTAWGDVTLRIPLRDQPFRHYPVRLRLPRPGHEPFGRKALLRTPFAYVSGTVEIGGKSVLVWVQYDSKKGGAFPDFGWQGVDVDQNGAIQTGANSPEHTFAKDERVVFHVNGKDVSIANVDLVNKTISLREHTSGVHGRIALHTGAVIPDFSFRDLAGREHALSEFRGKYVLLDFWGTWCPPCIRLLPELQSIHEELRERGLVVLGLPSHEENSQAGRAVLEKQAVTFLQADPDSVRDVVEKRFRIDAFPTHLLIGPDGRITHQGESLRPPHLRPLLEDVFRDK